MGLAFSFAKTEQASREISVKRPIREAFAVAPAAPQARGRGWANPHVGELCCRVAGTWAWQFGLKTHGKNNGWGTGGLLLRGRGEGGNSRGPESNWEGLVRCRAEKREEQTEYLAV